MLQYCFRILFSTASLNNVLSRPFTWFKKKKNLKNKSHLINLFLSISHKSRLTSQLPPVRSWQENSYHCPEAFQW